MLLVLILCFAHDAQATHATLNMYGRKLSSSPAECTIQSERFYELTKSCRLTDEIIVPNGKTLTIVGIGAPTIERDEKGRHFYVTGGGHLKMTGVTLADGFDDRKGGSAVIRGSEARELLRIASLSRIWLG